MTTDKTGLFVYLLKNGDFPDDLFSLEVTYSSRERGPYITVEEVQYEGILLTSDNLAWRKVEN